MVQGSLDFDLSGLLVWSYLIKKVNVTLSRSRMELENGLREAVREIKEEQPIKIVCSISGRMRLHIDKMLIDWFVRLVWTLFFCRVSNIQNSNYSN